MDEKIALLEAQLAQSQKELRGGHGAQRRGAGGARRPSPTAAARPPRRPPPSAPYVAVVQAAATEQEALATAIQKTELHAAHRQAGGAAAHPARGGRPGLAERPAP